MLVLVYPFFIEWTTHEERCIDALVYYVLTKNQEFDIDKWHSIVERQLDKRKFVKKENTNKSRRQTR